MAVILITSCSNTVEDASNKPSDPFIFVSSVPVPNSVDAETNQLTIFLNEEVDTSTIQEKIIVTDSSGSQILGSTVYEADNKAIKFVPQSNWFPLDSLLNVTINPGIKSVLQKELPAVAPWSFTTRSGAWSAPQELDSVNVETLRYLISDGGQYLTTFWVNSTASVSESEFNVRQFDLLTRSWEVNTQTTSGAQYGFGDSVIRFPSSYYQTATNNQWIILAGVSNGNVNVAKYDVALNVWDDQSTSVGSLDSAGGVYPKVEDLDVHIVNNNIIHMYWLEFDGRYRVRGQIYNNGWLNQIEDIHVSSDGIHISSTLSTFGSSSVIWEAPDSSNGSPTLFSSIFDPVTLRSPMQSLESWNGLSSKTFEFETFQAKSDDQGNMVNAWYNPTDYIIQLRRFNQSVMTPPGIWEPVSTIYASDVRFPVPGIEPSVTNMKLHIDKSNSIHLFWENDDTSNINFQVAQFSKGAPLIEVQPKVLSAGSVENVNIVDSNTGAMVVTWDDLLTTNKKINIYQNGVWFGSRSINDLGAGSSVGGVDIIFDNQDNAMLIWSETQEVHTRRLVNRQWSDVKQTIPQSSGGSNFKIVSAGAGAYVAVWQLDDKLMYSVFQ